MLKRAGVYSIFLCALAPVVQAADVSSTKPAAVDFSDPRKTVQAFLMAVQSTDAAAIKRTIVAAPEQQTAVDTIVGLWVAQAKLRLAAEGKYGDQATPYFGTVSSQVATRLKALADAPLKVMEDSAILTVPGDETNPQAGGTVVLKKIGDAWKIDAGTLFNLATASKDVTDQRMTLASKLVMITDAMTADIGAGKFPSAGEAYQEFWNRSLAASKQVDAATTAPATRAK